MITDCNQVWKNSSCILQWSLKSFTYFIHTPLIEVWYRMAHSMVFKENCVGSRLSTGDFNRIASRIHFRLSIAAEVTKVGLFTYR